MEEILEKTNMKGFVEKSGSKAREVCFSPEELYDILALQECGEESGSKASVWQTGSTMSVGQVVSQGYMWH